MNNCPEIFLILFPLGFLRMEIIESEVAEMKFV